MRQSACLARAPGQRPGHRRRLASGAGLVAIQAQSVEERGMMIVRCDANPQWGMGHLTRCRALAVALHQLGMPMHKVRNRYISLIRRHID